MAEVTQKRIGELHRGVFKILIDNHEGLPAKEVLKRMEQVVPPAPFEKSDYPNARDSEIWQGDPFATIAPVKAAWMIKDEGEWFVSAESKKHI
jgi:restriction system protein